MKIIIGVLVAGGLFGAGTGNAPPKRCQVAPSPDVQLWPGGTIPYAYEPNYDDTKRQRVEEAISDWNDRSVIRFVPRSDEADYVHIQASGEGFSDNPSDCGWPRIYWTGFNPGGGPQRVCLNNATDYAMRHELGHAIGLHHEQARVDREEYIRVYDGTETRIDRPFYWVDHPYNYRSVMHVGWDAALNRYWDRSKSWMESIPYGIQVGSAAGRYTISVGDIDRVNRMYMSDSEIGQLPIVISSNPTGLRFFADGKEAVTPAKFDWPDGSNHAIRFEQNFEWGGICRGGDIHVFRRWNDDGMIERDRTLRVNRAVGTWYEAHFAGVPTHGIVTCLSSRVRARQGPDGAVLGTFDVESCDSKQSQYTYFYGMYRDSVHSGWIRARIDIPTRCYSGSNALLAVWNGTGWASDILAASNDHVEIRVRGATRPWVVLGAFLRNLAGQRTLDWMEIEVSPQQRDRLELALRRALQAQ